MRFSIVTPTFNRRAIVARAIDSALPLVRAFPGSEIVAVDDASRDGTVEMLQGAYARELTEGLLKLVVRPQNGGSTAAKADGARSASGDWLVFLDSDDELLPEATTAMPAFIAAYRETPVFFFRCIDQAGRLIGPLVLPRALSLTDLLSVGTPGECLPVISRPAFVRFPPDNDPAAFEFLSTLRVVQAYGPAMLSDAIARRYYTEHEDRLTSRSGNLRRVKKHVEGFRRTLREFGALMPLRKRAAILVRIFCYSLIGFFVSETKQK